MLLQRTDKARSELLPGVRTLGLRERSLLLLVDGHKRSLDFGPMYNGEGEQIILSLVQRGYLEPSGAKPGFKAGDSGTFAISTAAFNAAVIAKAAAPARPAAPISVAVAVAAAPRPAVSADAFEGKRSLATTRMFLFDICERMFARRDPVQAESFRKALRNAKDRVSMLDAGREMIAEIERVAGHERADSISERIAMLMPPEAAL